MYNATRSVLIGFVMLTALIFSGCGTTQQFDTGLPASSAEKFFFHMEHEALEQGFATSRNLDNSQLSIQVDRGELDYIVAGDEVVLTVYVYDTSEMPESDVRERVYTLKDLSDKLIEGATERAKSANVFE